mmetsp:Transcript_126525/g.369712  ORF Transcript_126525/g.369712 Transcript_126525/m.369712 type:complete len:217 (+) Transcript_126525:123-773(+)
MCPGVQDVARDFSAAAGSRQVRPQPTAWDWQCGVCTFLNLPSSNPCEMCGLPRGTRSEEPASEPDVRSSTGQRAPPLTTWDSPQSTVAPPGRAAGRELLAALKRGAQLPGPEAAAPGARPPPDAGREILAALECNRGKHLLGPEETLLAALKPVRTPTCFEGTNSEGLCTQWAEGGADGTQPADGSAGGGEAAPRQRRRARQRARGRAVSGAQRSA